MDVQPFWSVDSDVMCSNTGERLTSWMDVQPSWFWSVDLICLNREGLTCWMDVQAFWSVDLIHSNTREPRDSQADNGYSAILVRGCDQLKHWRGTHKLHGCSAIPGPVSLFKHQRMAKRNSQAEWMCCSAILVSGSDPLKHWRGTHILNECSAILVSGSDLLKHC